MADVDGDITERLRIAPVEDIVLARPATAIDALRVAEGLTAFYGMQIVERLRTADQLDLNTISNVTLLDMLTLVEHLGLAYNATLTDGVGIADPLVFQRLLTIVENLGLSESLAGAARYHMSIAQGLRLTTSLGNFFGVDVLDWLDLGENMVGSVLAHAGLTDEVGIAATVTPQLLISVVLDEAIDITPELALRMLFNPTIIEGIELTAGMLEPNGSFTTWAMNTRTGAVTEYADFVFNSFAQVGNKYLGASESGIFELLGDDDDGVDIVARIKSGYLQFGGTQLSRLKEAYIAATGEGTMILRILTKDGEVYNYSVDTRDGRSTKVPMGKGQRSRYFAFELISAGQDFDLDTLEFVPIVVQRRV